ncbi:LPD1 domain-containing protein [Cupriavidus nantongensis]|nr:LPD1 domain-containing protein [Cupriavidus nantongensis]
MSRDNGSLAATSLQMDLFSETTLQNAQPVEQATAVVEEPAQPQQAAVASKGGPAVAAAVETAPVVVGGIADAGEELVANRRNRGKVATTWSDLEGLNDTLKVKETVKGNVWLKPDYQQLIDAGMQPMVAHIVKQVYDSVAAKPAVSASTKTTDAHLQTYIGGMQRIEQGLMKWTQDTKALKAWANSNIRVAGAMLGKQVALSELGPATSLLEYVYPDGWRAHRDELRIVGGNKLLGALQPGYEEIKRAGKAIDAGWPNKRESWEVQGYKVLERPRVSVDPNEFRFSKKYSLSVDRYYIDTFNTEEAAQAAAAAIKPFVLVGKRGFLDSFDSRELAVEAAKERSRGGKDTERQLIEKGYNVIDAERVGVSRRMEGEDISSERLMEEFGLRGVNFGNWMKTPAARAEAQMHLNHAYDAFHDLADILDVPPKVLSLGGMLGLAIGAQGHGGRNAAHFVPGVNEINLTRTTGAGALAHEWAHAVDHYFARQAGLDTAEEPYLSEHALLGETKTRHELVAGKYVPVSSPRFGEVRPEIVGAFKGLVQTMTKRLQTVEEAQAVDAAYQQRLEKNVNGWLASIGRDFKEQEAEFAVLAERVRKGDFGGEMVAVGRSTLLHPVVVEMRDLYKAKHGRVYSIEQLKGLQSNLDSLAFRRDKSAHQQAMAADADVVPERRRVSTDYALNAAKLDKDKGGKVYWSTKCELFARAFDSFVADKLEAKQAKNSYLSFGVRETETVPVGTERDAIHSAFDGLIGEFVVRESELGPALFSAGPGRGSALPLPEIHAEIERLRGEWKGMPPVLVVGKPTDLPFEAPSNADGAYHDGKVYVVAGNIGDMRQLQKVMAHECIMHHSLEEMLGNYGFAKLHHGVQSLIAKGDETVCAIAENVRSRYGVLPPDIQTKEIVARAGEQCLDEQGNVRVQYGFMKGVFAGVTGWLRDHGISVPFTNVELQGILHKSAELAKDGPLLRAGRREQSLQEKVVGMLSGLFVGKILGVADGVVTQKVGRAGETVLHSMADLSGPIEVGEIAEIAYKDGKGLVREPEQHHVRSVDR